MFFIFFLDFIHQYFYKTHAYNRCLIKALGSLQIALNLHFLICYLIIDILSHMDAWYTNKFYQYPVDSLLDQVIHLFFTIESC